MAIISSSTHKVLPREYPYLGISAKGKVILFTSLRTGTVLIPDPTEGPVHNAVGFLTDGWFEENYHVLDGSITLSNAQ